ncbi:MAG: hypothetical protein R2909_03355 [Gemmatimonadales bacterium]
MLVPAHAGAQQVASVDPEDFGLILQGIDVLEGEAEASLLEARDHVIGNLLLGLGPRSPGFPNQLQGIERSTEG